jgi:archaellum biogenesis protein FlaJ (TadC family)
MSDWESAVLWLTLISVATFLGSLLTLPWLVAKIPETYFLESVRSPTPWHRQRPALRLMLLMLKNMLGAVLLAGGILMLFLPGQGLLTMALGLLLLDYPGKYRFERWLVAQPSILRSLNWLRRRRGVPPLQVAGDDTPGY